MGDIKLFSLKNNKAIELEGRSVALEKSLQNMIEKNLEAFLGVRFLVSEYATGKTHGGRIDTLGIDENACPVIIEYKRATNENVINQGLFYLDWLMDHKANFEQLVQKSMDKETSEKIEWSAPRLLCIAGDFTKYDVHAVQQIDRNIELIRYRRYGDELILFDLVNATTATGTGEITGRGKTSKVGKPLETQLEYINRAKKEIRDRFESLKSFMVALGDDVQMKPLACYIAFKRIKNFACVEARPQSGALLLFLKVSPKAISLEKGFTRDVSKIGHLGTGDLEVSIRSNEDLEKSKPLIIQSYEGN